MTLFNIVLVGVDGSPESGAALRYAVAEANRRGARLRVVSTYFPEASRMVIARLFVWRRWSLLSLDPQNSRMVILI